MVERWNATAKELLREVQLLQRGRATIHVVENFAKFKHRIMACSWNLGYCHSMSLEMDHTIGRSARFHWRSMALSCIVSDVKRGIGRKSRFFIPHLQTTTPIKGPRRNKVVVHVSIGVLWPYLVSFPMWSEVLVENRDFSYPICKRRPRWRDPVGI